MPAPLPIYEFPVGNPGGQMPSVYVYDCTNDYDLYLRLADVPSPFPASTVKLMTLLLMREYHAADWTTGTVTIGAGDFPSISGAGSISVAGFQVGDVVTWQDLAYGLVLPSGGDAALAAARVIGDEIYAAAGNTGTQGVTRFVERMNERAGDLSMDTAVYTDPFGGSKTFSPDVLRNQLSARDLSIVAQAAFTGSTARAIAGTTSYTATVTGPHARSINWGNVFPFVNGPTIGPTGVKDTGVIAGKTGSWSISLAGQFNIVTLWRAPAGQEILIVTVGSSSFYAAMLDQRGLMYMAIRDFPYLLDAAGDDADLSSVRLLIGADEAITDEGPDGRTLTVSGPVIGNEIVAESDGAIKCLLASDSIDTPDSANLAVGSGDWTAEVFYAAPWYPGFGAVPGANTEYAFLHHSGAGVQREWGFSYYNSQFIIYASSDGSGWATSAFTMSAGDQAVFFNGAPRHLALVRSGGMWRLYVNGEKVASISSAVFNGTANLRLPPGGIAPIGLMDEIRISAVARYTGDMPTIVPRKFPRT